MNRRSPVARLRALLWIAPAVVATAQEPRQLAYLKASSPEAGAEFGAAVAVSGEILVVGAPAEAGTGAAHVFTRRDGGWQWTARLQPAQVGAGDRFGHAVAVSGDWIVVGANGEDSAGADPLDNSASAAGAAYVFHREGEIWRQHAFLKAANAGAGDAFGSSVAIDGVSLAIGAIGEDGDGAGENDNRSGAGAVYLFTRGEGGWSQQAFLKARVPGAGDGFGFSVSLAGDLLAIGAAQEDGGARAIGGDETSDAAPDAGAAYVFRRRETGWIQEAYLKPTNAGAGDQFGFAVAAGAGAVAVTAPREASAATGVDGNGASDSAAGAGAAYVFRHDGALWRQEAYFKASNTAAGDGFGQSVALGDRALVVGAMGEDSNATGVNGRQDNNIASAAGAAYTFELEPSGWRQSAYLKASNTGASDQFGRALALDRRTLVVGANLEAGSPGPADNAAPAAGAAYVFHPVGPAGPEPELDVEHAGEPLADRASQLDFGQAGVGQPAARRWLSLYNRGTAPLTVTGIFLTGSHAEDFTVAGGPWPAVVAPGDSLEIEVAFAPRAVGRSVAALVIASDDADESRLEIALTGAALPEIEVSGQGRALIDGDSSPDAADGTAFPATARGGSARRVFEIANSGVADLRLGEITLAGPDAADFSVSQPPATTVGPGASVFFEVTFRPTRLGRRGAQVRIASDDVDENPFRFAVEGTGGGPGLPDAGFGTAGTVFTAVGSGHERAAGVVSQPDGKCVVVGRTERGADVDTVVLRYLADGTPDPAFGTQGSTVTTVATGFDEATAVALDGEGRILTCGTAYLAGNDDFVLLRHLPDGRLDPDFGTGGLVTAAFGPSDDRAHGLVLQRDGKIVVTGTSHDGAAARVAIARFLPDGSADPAFGAGGQVLLPIGVDDAAAHAIAIQRDGALVLTGQADGRLFVLRLTPDGEPDAAFANAGVAFPELSGESAGHGVGIGRDGKITVAGWVNGPLGADWLVARWLPDGRPDAGFGVAGVAVVDLPDGHDELRALAVQPDGGVFATGFVRHRGTDDFALLRLLADGSPDPAFGENGWVATPLGPGADRAAALAVQADGRVVAAGYADRGGQEDIALVRYTAAPVERPAELVIEHPAGRELPVAQPVVFGDARLGAAGRSVELILWNAGTRPLSISSVSLTGPAAADFTLSPTPPPALLAGDAETSLTVRFQPTAAGPREAVLRLVSDDADRPEIAIPLSGTGVFEVPQMVILGNGVAITPGALQPRAADGTDFASTPTGGQATRTFIIRNTGNAPLQLAAAVEGGAGAFRISREPAAATLAPGGEADFQLTFQPSQTGLRQARIRLSTNDPERPETFFTVAGRATGVASLAVLDEAAVVVPPGVPVALGSVTAGAGSVSRALLLENRGTAELVVNAVTLHGAAASGFTVNTAGMATALRPGGRTSLTVSYASAAPAVGNAELRVSTNDPAAAPRVIALSASAVAPAPVLVLSPAGSMDFGSVFSGQTAVRTLQIRNAGTAVLQFDPPVLAGSAFRVTRQPAGRSLAPGAAVEMEITFAPAAPGLQTGSLTWTSNDPVRPSFQLSLAGSATGRPELDVETAAGEALADAAGGLDFGFAAVGDAPVRRSVWLLNRGDAELRIAGVELVGTHAADFSATPGVPGVLAPGAAVLLEVAFSPSAGGRRVAELRITSNDDDEPQFTLQLSGAAFPDLRVVGNGRVIAQGDSQPQPEDFTDFGTAEIHGGRVVRRFEIRNDGTALLLVEAAAVAGDHAGDFHVAGALPVSLQPGASAEVEVAFTPTRTGPRRAEVRIPSNDPDEPLFHFSIAGTGGGSGSRDGGFAPLLARPGDEHAAAAAVADGGRIVLAGYTAAASGTAVLVVRLTADGAPDPTFGSGGRVVVPVGDGLAEATALAIQPDGRLVVAGFAHDGGQNRFLVLRLLANGQPDPSFGTGGVVRTALGGADAMASSLVLQPDGGIVLAGSATTAGRTRLALVRHRPDGTLDAGFGQAGIVVAGAGVEDDRAAGLVLQPDGKLVAGGTSDGRFLVARFHPDGSPDSTFGTGGTAVAAVSAGEDEGTGIALEETGGILLAGHRFTLLRFSTAGVLDGGFGTAGMAAADFGGPSEARALTVQADGRIVLAGSALTAGQRDFALARFTAGGMPDATFGGDGRVIVPVSPAEDGAAALALQADGRIVAAGSSIQGNDRDLAVVRLLGDTRTEPPVLSAPAAQSDAGRPVRVAFELPEPAAPGSVRLVFAGASTHELALTAAARGVHDFTFDPDAPASSPAVAHGPPVPPGVYTVTLRYQDAAGNPAASAVVAGVILRTPQELWRQRFFGTMTATGPAADQADPDDDGVPNLLEFAFGTHPTDPASGGAGLRLAGTLAAGVTGFEPGQPVVIWEVPPYENPCADHPECLACWETGDADACATCGCAQAEPHTLVFDGQLLFLRREDAAAAGLRYAVEESADLRTWAPAAGVPVVVARAGGLELVRLPAAGGAGSRFLRISVRSGD